MPYFVVIKEKRQSSFSKEAKTILSGHRFSEVTQNTYSGSSGTSQIVQQLKNLDSFKKERGSYGIEIFHGSLSTA